MERDKEIKWEIKRHIKKERNAVRKYKIFRLFETCNRTPTVNFRIMIFDFNSKVWNTIFKDNLKKNLMEYDTKKDNYF